MALLVPPNSSWMSSEMAAVAMVATGIVLLLFQAPPIGKARLMLALALVAAFGAVVTCVDSPPPPKPPIETLVAIDPCLWIEPGSIRWYTNFCFLD